MNGLCNWEAGKDNFTATTNIYQIITAGDLTADADGYLAVKPSFTALAESAGSKNLVALAQDDIGYDLLKIRSLLGLGSGHILMLISDYFKQLRRIFGYKAVFACNKFFDLFSFYY